MNRNTMESVNSPVEISLTKGQGRPLRLAEKLGPRRARTKIFLVFTAVMSGFILLFAALFFRRFEERSLRDITADATAAAQTISGHLARGLERKPAGDPGPLLAAVCEPVPGLKYAIFEDTSGRILASVNPEEAAGRVYRENAPPLSLKESKGLLGLAVPLTAGGDSIGRLLVGFSFPEKLEALGRERERAVAIGLLALAISSAFVFLASGIFTRPLTQLTRTTERIAAGDLSQRARIYSRDEAGLLARSFNAMMDGLERSHRDLEGVNRSLEEQMDARSRELEREILERHRIEQELRLVRNELDVRVEKRTEKLSQVNEDLHGTVRERRRAEDQLQNSLKRLERALEGTVKAWSLTGEMRDFYTAGHQCRVASLAVAIAEEMHLSWEKVEGLRVAGIIHDIGKIAMPAEILAKPSRLTKTEFQLIKDHPRIGYEIVKSIEFPWPVAHIILQHHERVDGSGYPEGLLGEAILLEARILAVADVVEALSSHRPYRPALGIEKALEEIRRGRGIRYDMRVVDTCLKLFRDRRFSFPVASSGPALHQ